MTQTKYTAKKHTAQKHTATKHTAQKHTAQKRTAQRHTAKKGAQQKRDGLRLLADLFIRDQDFERVVVLLSEALCLTVTLDHLVVRVCQHSSLFQSKHVIRSTQQSPKNASGTNPEGMQVT